MDRGPRARAAPVLMGTLRKWWTRFKSSITGKFVSRKYAEENPDTTQGTQVQRRVRKFKKDLR